MRLRTAALLTFITLSACSSEGATGTNEVICPDCEGAGVLVEETRKEDLKPGEGGSFSSSKKTETCARCNGTGKIND